MLFNAYRDWRLLLGAWLVGLIVVGFLGAWLLLGSRFEREAQLEKQEQVFSAKDFEELKQFGVEQIQ